MTKTYAFWLELKLARRMIRYCQAETIGVLGQHESKKAVSSKPIRTLRKEEEYARSIFDGFIRARSGVIPEWSTDHKDPPDLWLTLGEERIAVEVTFLFNRLEVTWSGISEEKPSPEIEARGRKLIAEIERDAISKNILTGEYFMFFPELSYDWFSSRSEIKFSALKFIDETQEVSASGIIPLGCQCSILKRSNLRQRVALGGGFGDSGWSGNAIQKSAELIQEILKRKRKSLTYLSEPKVLLMVDEYLVRTDYSDFSTEPEFLRDFDTVILISPFGDYPWMLHTVRDEWR